MRNVTFHLDNFSLHSLLPFYMFQNVSCVNLDASLNLEGDPMDESTQQRLDPIVTILFARQRASIAAPVDSSKTC